MADEQKDNPAPEAEAPVAEKPSYPPIGPDAPWSQVWQLPVLLLGVGLLALGVFVALPRTEPPNFDGALDNVARYLQADNLADAETKLADIQEQVSPDDHAHMGRMYAYYADLNYLQLHHKDARYVEPEDYRAAAQQVVRYYRTAADEYGYALSVKHQRRLARTLIDLDRHEEALAVIDQLPDQPAEHRYELIRRMIEQRSAGSDGLNDADLIRLTDRYRQELTREKDPVAQRRGKVWVTALEAQRKLDADPNEAIAYLSKHIQLLRSAADTDERALAPLHILLAKAYHETEGFDQADLHYEFARQRVEPNDELNAQVYVGKARILLSRGPGPDETVEDALHTALHFFRKAAQEFPSAPAYVDALIGQADVEARLGQHDLSQQHFAEAVESLQRAPETDVRRQRLTESVLSHATYASEQGDYDRALALLTTLRPLYGKELPASLLLRFALVHEQVAHDRLAAAKGRPGHPAPSADARRLNNQEAAIHFGESAEYFLAYAEAVTISHDEDYGDALWRAAHNFDRAQLWSQAIDAYTRFIRTRQEDDRFAEAQHLLGKAYMAGGDYASAIEHFQALIKDHPTGRWAHESLVPLARSLAATDQFSQAKATLIKATTDHPAITPESQAYREALIELGKLQYRLGREDPASYLSAIETLSECVQRFGATEDGPMLRYLLAESNRLSIKSLDEKLDQRRAQRERIALQAERLRRLEEAQIYYNQVITELEERDEQELSTLERTHLRNAYFYQADCAYDRGRYAQAIELYDEAAKRWSQTPASLVAYVQIVNAYCEMGDYRQAKLANETALWKLEQLPDEAFDDPNLPMTRQHWEDWLRWTSELDVFGSQANAQ